jgi:hypothetical protein
MEIEPTRRIEAWFTRHCDDGEFSLPSREVAYSVIWPASSASRMIVTTKPAVVAAAIGSSSQSDQFGMLGRYGLPSESDAGCVRDCFGPSDIWFLGDMDPVDLLVFSWWRASMQPKRLLYLGVGDALLRSLHLSLDSLPWIPCTQSETQSIGLLAEVFPDFVETVGTECAGKLMAGHKLEIEGVVAALGSPAALLRSDNFYEN